MNALPVLLLAAAGVGFGHAVLPDHWLPLAVLSRTRHYRTGKVARLSLAAAATHVVVSLLLGGVLIVAGLRFRTTVAHHTDLAVGGILLATGAVFLILELLGKGHGHDHNQGTHEHGAHDHHDTHDHAGHDHDAREWDDHPGHDAHLRDGHDHPGHDHGHQHAAHGRGRTAVLDPPTGQTQARGARGLAALLIPFGAAASPDLTILPVFLAAGTLGVGAALGSLAVFTIATIVTIVALTVATAQGARLLTAPWIDRSANLLTAVTLLLIGTMVASGLV